MIILSQIPLLSIEFTAIFSSNVESSTIYVIIWPIKSTRLWHALHLVNNFLRPTKCIEILYFTNFMQTLLSIGHYLKLFIAPYGW